MTLSRMLSYSRNPSHPHFFHPSCLRPQVTMLRSQDGGAREKQLSGVQHFKRLLAACYYSGVHTCNGKLNGPKWHYVHSNDGTDDSEYTRSRAMSKQSSLLARLVPSLTGQIVLTGMIRTLKNWETMFMFSSCMGIS